MATAASMALRRVSRSILCTRLFRAISATAALRVPETGRLPRMQQNRGIRLASTFVSYHYELPNRAVQSYLDAAGLSFRISGKHAVVRECPLCGKPSKGRADNMYKLYVSTDTGVFFCHRCGSKGSWFDFKRRLGGHSTDSSNPKRKQQLPPAPFGVAGAAWQGAAYLQPHTDNKSASKSIDSSSPIVDLSDVIASHEQLAASLDVAEAPGDDGKAGRFARVGTWLTKQRGISPAILKAYCVGGAEWGSGRASSQTKASTSDGGRREQFAVFPLLSRADQVESARKLAGDGEGAGSGDSSTTTAAEARRGGGGGGGPASQALGLVLHRCKLRSVSDKSKQMLLPKGGSWGLFGLHAVPRGARSIVLTEGELDAMSVMQATGVPAVSLPNGCRSLPLEVMPLLEPFETIFLWLDDDQSGVEGAAKMAGKLGRGRCRIVRTADGLVRDGGGGAGAAAQAAEPARPKDANDALRLPPGAYSFTQALQRSEPMPHKEILRFSDLRHAIQHELRNPDLVSGTPWRVLPGLYNLLKGHRSGELTVLTGPTGAGKTTLLSQLSLDLAAQGVPTLWGSFEVKNARLAKKMLQQYMGAAVVDTDNPQALDAAADAFEQLPLYFLRFFGGSPVEDVLDAMDYAVYAHDVSHIVLDNLQFMMAGASGGVSAGKRGRGGGGRGGGGGGAFERFEAQEAALDHFRRFASQRDVHVTLVIHPRKEPEDAPLTLSSVFGTAKATQEADNVLILQRAGDKKRLDVRKNRHDGSLGGVDLSFDAGTQMMVEPGSSESALPIAMMGEAGAGAREGAGAAGRARGAGGPFARAGALDFLHAGGAPPTALDDGTEEPDVLDGGGAAALSVGVGAGVRETEDADLLRSMGLGGGAVVPSPAGVQAAAAAAARGSAGLPTNSGGISRQGGGGSTTKEQGKLGGSSVLVAGDPDAYSGSGKGPDTIVSGSTSTTPDQQRGPHAGHALAAAESLPRTVNSSGRSSSSSSSWSEPTPSRLGHAPVVSAAGWATHAAMGHAGSSSSSSSWSAPAPPAEHTPEADATDDHAAAAAAALSMGDSHGHDQHHDDGDDTAVSGALHAERAAAADAGIAMALGSMPAAEAHSTDAATAGSAQAGKGVPRPSSWPEEDILLG